MSNPTLRTARSNLILAELPAATLADLLPDLDVQLLKVRQMLQPRDRKADHVVFPIDGVASMVSMGNSGHSIEVATIGREGMVGLPRFLGGEKASVEIFIQVPGKGMFLRSEDFKRHLKSRDRGSRARCCFIPRPCSRKWRNVLHATATTR